MLNASYEMTVETKELSAIGKAFKFGRRHFITAFFPFICFGAIYSDYKRTTLFKIRKASEGLP